MTSRRLLQIVVAVLAAIPVCTGAAGVVLGPRFVMAEAGWPVDLDSHFRFLSAIFLTVGLMFYVCVPSIERRTALFRIAAALVFAGGIGRLVSLLALPGLPSRPHLAGLGMELVVVPLLTLWQARVARRRT